MGLVNVPQTIPILDQLGPQMLLMAYSQKCLVFSPLVNGKQNTLKFSEEKKNSCYLLWIGRRPPRISQYKRKTWVLGTRIKLRHPSKAKGENHKSVSNPRRYLMVHIVYLGMSERNVWPMWVFETYLSSASSYTRSGAKERPNMQRVGTSPLVRPTEGTFLTSQIQRRT